MYFAHPVPRSIFPIKAPQARSQKILTICPSTIQPSTYLSNLPIHTLPCARLQKLSIPLIFLKLNLIFSDIWLPECGTFWNLNFHFKIIFKRDRWGYIKIILEIILRFYLIYFLGINLKRWFLIKSLPQILVSMDTWLVGLSSEIIYLLYLTFYDLYT